MRRRLPKTGETWRHYKGTDCLILGVLSNGNPRQPRNQIVALEVSGETKTYNQQTQTLEATKVIHSRFYRTLGDFQSLVDGQPRFVPVDDTGDLWGRIVELDEMVLEKI